VLKNSGKAKKSLGQNFLVDDAVIENIIDQGLPELTAPIIEVGPGTGALTRALAARISHFWAVELDGDKIELLQKEFSGQVALLHMDARKLMLKDLWGDQRGWLIGNLPYYITNPLLEHFLSQSNPFLG
jgi:16S rRNA (adenine1518-N6/adenine1519-N6)-dimethyltransferase